MLAIAVLLFQWYRAHFPNWVEEVKLSDGRTIELSRTQKYDSDHLLLETALTFDLPETHGQQTWRQNLYPVIFDVFQGRVYAVGAVTYKSAWQYQRPRYGYVAYVFSQGNWSRVPFISLPEAIRKSENIAFCATPNMLSSWQEKQVGWCNLAGQYVGGASRDIDILAHELNAKQMAELANTTTKSE